MLIIIPARLGNGTSGTFYQQRVTMYWRKYITDENDKTRCHSGFCRSCGAGGNRTRVQTPVEKAFYMLIPLLFVGNDQEADKPNHHLAGWS